MKSIISDCENFLEVNNMKFMAFEQKGCDGCYFHDDSSDRCTTPTRSIYCAAMFRKNKHSVIWLRTE